jgi:hypothetical protein
VYPDAHPAYVVGKCLKAEVPTMANLAAGLNASLANTGIENSAWPCKYAITSDNGLAGQEKRIGINVVPAKLPSLVKFRTPNTPYADPACANSPLLVLSGKVSEKMVDFAAYFASRGEKKVAGRCNATNYVWERNATLKQAMSDCTATECVGISWYDAQPLEFSNSAATQGPRDFRSGEPISSAGAVYLFRGCNGPVDDTTTVGWSSLMKNPAATAYPAPTANAGKVFKVGVSFQPETLNSSITLPSGWVADTGSTYASRGNGYNYGWTCTMPTLHPKFAPPVPIPRNSHDVIFSHTTSGMALALNMYPETRLDGQTIAPSANTTFARNLHLPCANGDLRLWEMEVPSGVYKVPPPGPRTRMHSRSLARTHACTHHVHTHTRAEACVWSYTHASRAHPHTCRCQCLV